AADAARVGDAEHEARCGPADVARFAVAEPLGDDDLSFRLDARAVEPRLVDAARLFARRRFDRPLHGLERNPVHAPFAALYALLLRFAVDGLLRRLDPRALVRDREER